MRRTLAFLASGLLLLAGRPLSGQGLTVEDLSRIVPDIYQALSKQFALGGLDQNVGLTAFRSLNIPMGGLAEGMGMAYSAVSQDSSYFESNPAASSTLDYTELSIYHNNWISTSKIESAVYTARYKDLGLGLGGKWLYLDFTGTDDFGDRIGSGYYSEAVAGVNVSYNFLSGYYFNGLALGGTAKLAYRAVPASLEEAKAIGNTALAFMVDGGLLTRFNFLKFYYSRAKNAAVGLTIRNVGPPVYGDPLPTVASLGLAYSPLRPFLFSLDISKPINLEEPAKSERMIFAAGFLLSVTDFFRFQAGFLLKGGNPRITLGTSFDIDLMRVSVNYTLDLTTQFTPLNRLSLQAGFALGDLGRAALAKKVESLYLYGLEAFASGDIATAITAWSGILELDPGFDPARESLRAAQGAVELQQRIEELQKLDQ